MSRRLLLRTQNGSVNKAEVEARARAIVSAARAGQLSEDDYAELKRELPDPGKTVRQLAGMANRANGENFLYLIGVDESDGSIHALDGQDPADWWARVEKRFHEGSPSLIKHLNVEFTPGETFTVLEFESTNAPYMIATGGSPDLEFPIRVGTRTRTARRHEVLAMVAQQQSGAAVLVLSASLLASWHASQTYVTTDLGEEEIPEQNRLAGVANLFVEPERQDAMLLPLHLMSGTLSGNGKSYSVTPTPEFNEMAPSASTETPTFGTRATHEGIVITGPGRCSITFSIQTDQNMESEWTNVDAWTLSLRFGIARSSRFVTTSVTIRSGGPYGDDTGISGYVYKAWRYLR